ncbi:PQ loop repeat family protein [Tritrichomonas foetus]|uniref:PQ loop repeat family protein n=1 Tax=Tritrichomonas foetus TaxID=1144522 RepID=A0A1J4K114_9EUKA|nr:PQ loop repeat family protein [Tritrichomonas foetus]|eukprot:OHT05071.1 PQ loop repeat family protein [Tritrichomonas foetus]
MYAQIPQIILNFKRKSTDGLSFAFLCLLVAGDLCNLLGALINHGLVTQIITASWFLIVDGFCVSQYFYYVWIRPKCSKKFRQENEGLIKGEYDALPAIPLLLAAASAQSLPSPRNTVYPNPYLPPELYGTILGWGSAISYISSRTPQIVKNCRRKKTEGVSCQFFISAVLGNTTYAASIFLKDPHWGYIWGQFPWLVGSAGILFFDFTVLFQFLFYGADKKVGTDISTINDLSTTGLSTVE